MVSMLSVGYIGSPKSLSAILPFGDDDQIPAIRVFSLLIVESRKGTLETSDESEIVAGEETRL